MIFQKCAAPGVPFHYQATVKFVMEGFAAFLKHDNKGALNSIDIDQIMTDKFGGKAARSHRRCVDRLRSDAMEFVLQWEIENNVDPYLMSHCPTSPIDLEHYTRDRLEVFQQAQNTVPHRVYDRVFKRAAQQRVDAWRRSCADHLVIKLLCVGKHVGVAVAKELSSSQTVH